MNVNLRTVVRKTSHALAGVLFVLALLAGCNGTTKRPLAGAVSGGPSSNLEKRKARVDNIGDLEVVTTDGEKRRLGSYFGSKLVVLIVSRGYFGAICPFCSTQMSQIARYYDKISKLGADVIVIFPVATKEQFDHWQDLRSSVMRQVPETTELPFTIVIDLQLEVVNKLGIRDELSLPATFIVDPKGIVRFSYIGQDPADRPSIETLLQQLQLCSTARVD